MQYTKGMFRGKKITVMGLGLLGRGVGDILFFAKEGADLIVTDIKTKKELTQSLAHLQKYPAIKFTLGKHDEKDFEGRDFIIKAAGVPMDSPYIIHAEESGVPVLMSTALFASLTEATIVGVTGTRGKTTVTHMLHEILKKAYKGTTKKVFLGGNIQGMATLPLITKVKKGDIVLLELDSWQLQGFGDLKLSPQIAVFTTFMSDHLNYYKGDLQVYFSDKAQIFRNQKSKDRFIAGEQLCSLPKVFTKQFPRATHFVSEKMLPKNTALKIPGTHNAYNAALAFATAKAMKVPQKTIIDALMSFKGVHGRLEKISDKNGVAVYNDTTATTPEALTVALESLGKKNNVILIMGGSDKMIDLSILKMPVAQYAKSLFLIPGTGTLRFQKEIPVPKEIPIFENKKFAKLVEMALSRAQSGDVVLLSPGFASFGVFKNEYDRGDQFREVVQKFYTKK